MPSLPEFPNVKNGFRLAEEISTLVKSLENSFQKIDYKSPEMEKIGEEIEQLKMLAKIAETVEKVRQEDYQNELRASLKAAHGRNRYIPARNSRAN